MFFLARWAHNAEAHGEGNTPSVRSITVPATMSNAPISFGQVQSVADDIILATGYEFSENGRRLCIAAYCNRPNAIWELKLDFTSGVQDSIVTLSATKVSDPSRVSHSLRPIPFTSTVL
jgi:hypothetical protein